MLFIGVRFFSFGIIYLLYFLVVSKEKNPTRCQSEYTKFRDALYFLQDVILQMGVSFLMSNRRKVSALPPNTYDLICILFPDPLFKKPHLKKK